MTERYDNNGQSYRGGVRSRGNNIRRENDGYNDPVRNTGGVRQATNQRRPVRSGGVRAAETWGGSGQNDPNRRPRQRQRGNSGGFRLIIILIIVLAVIALAVFGYFKFIKPGKEEPASEGDVASEYSDYDAIMNDENLTESEKRLLGIRAYLNDGKSALETFREFYPDDIVIYKKGQYIFTPIDPNLKKHDYTVDNLTVSAGGRWSYALSGDSTAARGIDVSSHQGEINWMSVASDNVDFAIIRAMYRGYSTGKLVEDEQFKANIEGAVANGIDKGVYVFTQAVSKQEVDEEISMLMGLIDGYTLEYPVVVDVEEADQGNGRMDQLTVADRTEIIKYYCEQIKDKGYKPMIYFNINGAALLVDLSQLEDFDKWFASYNEEFYYPYAYSIRQYSDTGRISGIEGNVDLNIAFTDKF